MSYSNRPDPSPATPPDKDRKLDLSITQVLGGALAAMTAAALGSRLGVGGTIIGAAVASVIAGVAGAVYTASLRHTRDKVATVLTSRRSDDATPGAVPEQTRVEPAARRRRSLPWKGVAAAAVATFAVALVALTGLESLAGGALSGGHGTTIEQVTKPEKTTAKHKSDDDSTGHGSSTPTPSSSATPTERETSGPTQAAPTETETPTTTQQPESSKPDAPTHEKTPAKAG
jgi:hypothetical protein